MVEITPPRGVDVTAVVDKARQCAEAGVDAINIPDGPRASSRLSPLVTAVRIQEKAGIEAILHFCCRDRNLIGMQSDILGASAIGVRNLLIITGDPPKLGEYPNATGVFDMDSIALTTVVRNLNRGVDIGGNGIDPPTSLVIGVGANPVAADLEREIERFRQKVLAGAEFAITQPVFEPECLFRFLDATRGTPNSDHRRDMAVHELQERRVHGQRSPRRRGPRGVARPHEPGDDEGAGQRPGDRDRAGIGGEDQGRVAGFAVSAPFGNVGTALAVLGKADAGAVQTL